MIKKITKKYYKSIYFGLFCLIIFAIIFQFLSVLSFPTPSYNFGKKDTTRIFPNFSVIQKFKASKNNLNQIKLALSNINLRDSDKIIFELHEESCDSMIAQMDLTRFSKKPPIFYQFFFSAITDSQDKTYCFKIKYSTENTTLKKSEYPEVLVDEPMFFSESFSNTRPGSNEKATSLVMRVAYQNENTVGNLNELKDRISQDKPFFLKNNYLTAATISFIVFTFILVFLILYRNWDKK